MRKKARAPMATPKLAKAAQQMHAVMKNAADKCKDAAKQDGRRC